MAEYDEYTKSQLLDPELEAAMKTLDEDLGGLPKVEYHLFVKKYLPLLVQEPGTVNMDEWVSVAKTPYHPVEVVKNGEVLYTVPPLLRRQKPHTASSSERSMSNISILVEKQANIHAPAAMETLRRSLLARIDPEDINEEYVREWTRILIDHGYLEKAEPTGTATDAISDGTSIAEAFTDEYEDL